MSTPFRARVFPPAAATVSLTVRMGGDTAWLGGEEEEEVRVEEEEEDLVAETEAATAEAPVAGTGAVAVVVASRQAFMRSPKQFPVCSGLLADKQRSTCTAVTLLSPSFSPSSSPFLLAS